MKHYPTIALHCSALKESYDGQGRARTSKEEQKLNFDKPFTVKSRVTKIVTNFVTFVFEKNFLMVRTNMDNLIINYTHVVHYNGRV